MAKQTEDECDNLDFQGEGQREVLIADREMDNFLHFIDNTLFPGRRNPLFIGDLELVVLEIFMEDFDETDPDSCTKYTDQSYWILG